MRPALLYCKNVGMRILALHTSMQWAEQQRPLRLCARSEVSEMRLRTSRVLQQGESPARNRRETGEVPEKTRANSVAGQTFGSIGSARDLEIGNFPGRAGRSPLATVFRCAASSAQVLVHACIFGRAAWRKALAARTTDVHASRFRFRNVDV